MIQRIKMLINNQLLPMIASFIHPKMEVGFRKGSSVIVQSTSDSWACASERAHRRK